jgi:hypothetical protein
MVCGNSKSQSRKSCYARGSWSQHSQPKGFQIEKEYTEHLDLATLAIAFDVLVTRNDNWVSADNSSSKLVGDASESSSIPDIEQLNTFFNKVDPVTDISKFVESLCFQANADAACLVVAAIYCDRVHAYVSEKYGKSFLLQTVNARRLLLAAVFVASKVCSLAHNSAMLSVSSWASAAEVSSEELELLEKKLVFNGLKAYLDVLPEEFEMKVAVLSELAEHRGSCDPAHSLPSLDESALSNSESRQPAAGRSVFNDLRSSPLAAQVEDDVLLQMVSAGRVRRFIPGIAVVNAGREGHSMFMVRHGKLSVRIRGVHKRFVEEGQVILIHITHDIVYFTSYYTIRIIVCNTTGIAPKPSLSS